MKCLQISSFFSRVSISTFCAPRGAITLSQVASLTTGCFWRHSPPDKVIIKTHRGEISKMGESSQPGNAGRREFLSGRYATENTPLLGSETASTVTAGSDVPEDGTALWRARLPSQDLDGNGR